MTDEGNYILDCWCGRIAEPESTAAEIRSIVGVVEHGLFLGMATLALVAGEDGVTEYGLELAHQRDETAMMGIRHPGESWDGDGASDECGESTDGSKTSKVWFITGTSTGFGRLLAEEVLKAGGRVIATARKPEQIAELVQRSIRRRRGRLRWM